MTGRAADAEPALVNHAPAGQGPAGVDPAREETMFLDASGEMILLGDIIRAPITINQYVHGTWGEYRIKKAPGGYLLSYLRSEKGQILPEGYTGGYMADCLPDEDEADAKTLVFTQVPIRVSGWSIIRDSDGNPEGGNAVPSRSDDSAAIAHNEVQP